MNWFHCCFLWKGCFEGGEKRTTNSALATVGIQMIFSLLRSHQFKMKAVTKLIIFEFKGFPLCLRNHTGKREKEGVSKLPARIGRDQLNLKDALPV